MKRLVFVFCLLILMPYLIFASLEVHFVDVGQGDSIIINADGHYGIIDGGPANKSQYLYTYVKNLGVNPFELIVITHTDSDHIGGIVSAVEAAGISRKCKVWCNDIYTDQRQFSSFKERVSLAGCKIVDPSIGTALMLGNAKITVIGPAKKLSNKNDNSIIIKLEYAGKSFLFMGDAERAEENKTYSSICKFFSSKTFKNILPTIPLAPTIATRIKTSILTINCQQKIIKPP